MKSYSSKWPAASVNRSDWQVRIDCDDKLAQYFLNYCSLINLSVGPGRILSSLPIALLTCNRPKISRFDAVTFLKFGRNCALAPPRGSASPLSENPRTAPYVVKVIVLGLFPWICFTITYTAITSASRLFYGILYSSISRPWFAEL